MDTINTLRQLQQLRQQALNQASSQLVQQKQLCQRYQSNINALISLADLSLTATPVLAPKVAALQMANNAHYKRHIQRVIDWQKQEQVLANIEASKLQLQLQQQACREKTVAVVLEQQQELHQLELSRGEQKTTDAQAAQCWQRRALQQGSLAG
ncbi:flagellar export protein FliJ [Yersinia frederiksenii]|uniref:Flagellar FliJ protein n=1 Tax=Yersinia alsatica TaxID=2890317 RepID=A0ABY5UUQ9_9GAMM|nr:flagellar export protein FliJ [Yersinia alsatica]OWF70201.1 flagellar export protein FliJ [Yersinia frederiksenii]UWM46465.1 flagellar export protein FliJ [Yersinia alsatica]CFQ54165.1 flagellar export protein FliJ [Yersinia frederiksenii]CNI21513.1 flagellar export protein FliJ [Yersinia frederiksenii]CNK51940.1 flagellar export protein FliJ [Yersinia frederiksenii]